jgi:hypothetical protein
MKDLSQAWWFVTVIPEFWRLRQEDHEFKASLGNIMSLKSGLATQ